MWGQVEVRTLADLHMLAMSTLESEKMDQGGPEDTRDKDYLDLDQPGAGKLETGTVVALWAAMEMVGTAGLADR